MRGFLAVLLFLITAPAAAGETRLAVGLGLTEIDKIQQQGVTGLEVVMSPEWKSIRPVAGFHLSESGDAFIYAGGLIEWRFGERWRGSFGLSAGMFRYEGGYQLGGPLEFQSRIMLERLLASGIRYGFTYQHLSHGGLFGNNPGSERLLLTLALPLS